ncbi:hypothetical protein L3X38_012959 [Prunus dulcis]|uniref:WRKY domain-containing protein n=1 Tax=Prunus dulcis TaxID=3755 RepID=A0AAD4ZFQ3_PRUDU|nr:hypothetical protein L3X38_012959 [Prunus dulcis]
MEGDQRGVPSYEVQISFSSTPNPQQSIHEMGFVQFEDHHPHHNQVLSFMAPSSHIQQQQPNNSHHPHHHQPAELSSGASAAATTTSNGVTVGFSTHTDLLVARPSWNNSNDQVGTLDPKAISDENGTGNASDCSNSWWRSSSSEKSKMKVRRKLREPRFCFQTRSDVDVLDDGYKWRKYGQKVVKNSLHPRSYYRCTHSNCRVKKRVERLSEDCRMLVPRNLRPTLGVTVAGLKQLRCTQRQTGIAHSPKTRGSIDAGLCLKVRLEDRGRACRLKDQLRPKLEEFKWDQGVARRCGRASHCGVRPNETGHDLVQLGSQI